MGELNLIKQKESEKLRKYCTRVKELRARIIHSQRKTVGVEGAVEEDQAEANATKASIDSAVLRSFIRGLLPHLRDIVSWKQPKTFEVAFALAQKKGDYHGRPRPTRANSLRNAIIHHHCTDYLDTPTIGRVNY
jgi:hypothetical protein